MDGPPPKTSLSWGSPAELLEHECSAFSIAHVHAVEGDAVYAEGIDALTDGAELIVWPDPCRDFLRVDAFGLSVPGEAEILGIATTIRRAGGCPDEVADSGVELIGEWKLAARAGMLAARDDRERPGDA